MIKLKIFLIIILISQVCSSQNFSLNIGETKSKDYYTEITFEFIKDKIIIPVTIENKTYRFILDTGAPNLISKELYSIISSDSLATISITDTNQKEKKLKVVSIPQLILGNIIFENTATLVHDINQNGVFSCFKIDGLIGSNMLRNSIIQIQLKNKLIILTDNKKRLHLNKKRSSKISLLSIQSSPFIWVKLKGENYAKEQVLIDTGADILYNMSNKNFKSFKNKDIFTVIDSSIGTASIGAFGSGKKTEEYRILLPKIEIANNTLINFVTATSNDKFSVIGSKILNYGDITVDFKNKRFYFDSFKDEIDLKKKKLGFDPTFINDKIVVGFVWDKALKKLISFGDEIIEVNNLIIQESDFCNLFLIKDVFNNYEKFHFLIKKKNGEMIELNIDKKYFPETVYLQNN